MAYSKDSDLSHTRLSHGLYESIFSFVIPDEKHAVFKQMCFIWRTLYVIEESRIVSNTITEIINRQKTQDQSRYDPPVNTNILYRMPISRSSNNVLTGNETATIIKNDSGLENARRYFGPVDIKTLKVKLLNDKGYPIDLSADWSFSLVAERHYQY